MPDPECVEGQTEVKIRRCVNGAWVEGWIPASELGGESRVAAGCSGCEEKAKAKAAAIKLAGQKNWDPKDLAEVLKAIG